MVKKLQYMLGAYLAIPILGMCLISLSANQSVAQPNEPDQSKQLQPLHSGVDIYGFTGKIRWYTFYRLDRGENPGLEEDSQTNLELEFRNISMLGSHFGLGYKVFSTVFMTGFFESGGLGGVGTGPVARYYPLETTRWQPYMQGNFVAGYNLALSDALGINDVGGFRFRSGLRAGLDYKVSSAFGLFVEVGPTWEYDEGGQLDSRAIQFDLGIELFRF